MASNRNHFDIFEPHTILKHRILKHYIESWGRKMLLRDGAGDTIRFVDACAGAGGDSIGNDGSPIQAIRANVIAQAQISSLAGRSVTIHTVAIEKHRMRYKELRVAAAAWEDNVDVRQGILPDYIDEFSDGIPTLFFIDPFGLEPLRAELVCQALSGDKNEVLALFNDEGALRLLGGTKSDEDIVAELAAIDAQPGLFPELTAEIRVRAELDAQRKIAHRAKGRPRAETILTSTLGNESWREIPLEGDTMERLHQLLNCYTQQLKAFGAMHVLAMQVRKAEGTRAYKLVHATKSAKGYRTMKEAYDAALRSLVTEDVFPNAVADKLRADMQVSAVRVANALAKRYAGYNGILWTESTSGIPSLKRDILQRTPMLPSQMDEVKQHLAKFKEPGRKLVYSFPVLH